MINILIAEDNSDFRKLIKIHLKRTGYQVFEASDGAEALDILAHTPVHLLIADIMMPNMDGFELTSQIRSVNYTLPILIISAKSQLDDKREGFKNGADDYMTKPIDMDEMLLRVEALLRRARMSEETILTVGDCTLDENTLIFSCGNNQMELRQKEFYLLHKLLSYPDKIFTRQTLMDEIWGFDSETDPRTVDVHIKRLREKLSDVTGFEIQTIRGLGYKAVIKH